ncbi:MAG: hypothetical protein AAEC10_09220 [Rhodospirillales bacterium]
MGLTLPQYIIFEWEGVYIEDNEMIAMTLVVMRFRKEVFNPHEGNQARRKNTAETG